MEQRLPDSVLKELKKFHKKLSRKSDAYKINCLVLWGKGWTWEEISEALLISDHVIQKVISTYKEKGIDAVLKMQYVGHNFKLTNEQEKELCEYLDSRFILNAKQACAYVKRKFKVHYTQQGMVKTLIRLGYSYKKPKGVPMKIPSQEEQKECADTIIRVIENQGEEGISFFLDATGFEHNVKLACGWFRKGTEKIIKTNNGRKKLNVNGAYNPEAQETITVTTEGSINSKTNIELVDKIVNMHADKKIFNFFLDNARYNKSLEFMYHVKELEKIQGIKIILRFLPIYSPNLNLIERLWKKAKRDLLVNKFYSNFNKFKETVQNYFENTLKKVRKKRELKKQSGLRFQIIKV